MRVKESKLRTFQPARRVTSGWLTARSAGMLTSAALISTTAARGSFVSTQWGAGAAACLGTSWEMTGRLALILTASLDEIYYNLKIHQH